MTGFKTVIFNALGALLIALLTWVVGFDWTAHVSPSVAMLLVFAANTGLRFVTKTPIGQSE